MGLFGMQTNSARMRTIIKRRNVRTYFPKYLFPIDSDNSADEMALVKQAYMEEIYTGL